MFYNFQRIGPVKYLTCDCSIAPPIHGIKRNYTIWYFYFRSDYYQDVDWIHLVAFQTYRFFEIHVKAFSRKLTQIIFDCGFA